MRRGWSGIELDRIETLDDALNVIKLLLAQVSRAEALENRVAELERENRALREELAVLKKDSSTSSKPPSSDITQPPDRHKSRGKRKRGAQRGHSAKFRLLAEEVDRTEELYLKRCPECRSKLRKDKVHSDILVQQTAELRDDPVEVIEYRRYGCLCESCQAYCYPELPEGVIARQLFGPKLQALVGYLKGNLGASYTEIQQYFTDVLGLTVSKGLLCKAVSRVSAALKVPVAELEAALPQQNSLNIDETGWKDSGASYWVWVFCSSVMAYFTISSSRGTQVLRQVLGETFSGAITSDFFSAYTCYANPRQQFCLAHLIRDIKFLTTLPDRQSKEFGEQVLKYFRKLFQHWHRRKEYPLGEFEKKAQRLQRKLFTYLSNTKLHPGKAHTLKKRIVKHWKNLFCFVSDPMHFQPTNNSAEQALRHLVRIRRQTQGSRSLAGRQWNARIMTVLETCRKQQYSPWRFITQAVRALHFREEYPTLVPA